MFDVLIPIHKSEPVQKSEPAKSKTRMPNLEISDAFLVGWVPARFVVLSRTAWFCTCHIIVNVAPAGVELVDSRPAFV